MEPLERIVSRILLVRGQKVLLDTDLAGLHGVSTKRFNEQVRRNKERFPRDFMFQLTAQELTNLRSQIATSSLPDIRSNWGGRRYLPHVFTEHGAIMTATILPGYGRIGLRGKGIRTPERNGSSEQGVIEKAR